MKQPFHQVDIGNHVRISVPHSQKTIPIPLSGLYAGIAGSSDTPTRLPESKWIMSSMWVQRSFDEKLSFQGDKKCRTGSTSTFSTASDEEPKTYRQGGPLPPQHHVYDQAQEGARAGAGRGRGQAYKLTVKEATTSDEVVVGCGARCPEQEP